MVKIRVPATTANLACGFDTLGCALNIYNTLSFEKADKLSFSGCAEEFANADNLAWQGFRAVYEHLGQTASDVHISISADIPVCRGMGSSAAMIAAGAVAANEMTGAKLSREELLSIVTPIEGHPDNLAPALLGGLTASLMADGRVRCAHYPVAPELRFTVLYPDYTLSTHLARAALPGEVPFGDAVFDISRLALLPKALAEGDEELLSLCLRDKLHQPYRRSLIHGYGEVEAAAESLGCRAVCVSGAGPSILCVTKDETFAHRMQELVSGLAHSWTVLALQVDNDGADVV